MKYIKATLFLLLLLGGNFNNTFSQQSTNSNFTDKLMLKIPDSLTTNTNDISYYINLISKSEDDKLRAIFVWITNNIEYDVVNKYNYGNRKEDFVNTCLKTRLGICSHYASLFVELAIQSGIRSYIVLGYTKKSGLVNCEPHSWCVAMIDSAWYMFDPTLGAGIVQYSEFAKQIDDSYFKMKPGKSIKTHMPFDPLWQFLDYPIRNTEFAKNNLKYNREKSYFNYTDTLLNYQKQTSSERLNSIVQRIEENGVNSYLIYLTLQQYKNEIESIYYNKVISKYDSAVYAYKESVYLFNQFIDSRNNQFKPDKSDLEIKQNIDSVEKSLVAAKRYIDKIKNPNPKMSSSVEHLYKSIELLNINIEEQKKFLEKYFNTPKNYRKSLFYEKM